MTKKTNNSQAEDAYIRILTARTGSLIAPSPEYLRALRRYLYQWLEEIDAELSKQDAMDEQRRSI